VLHRINFLVLPCERQILHSCNLLAFGDFVAAVTERNLQYISHDPIESNRFTVAGYKLVDDVDDL
jgi:hypothetical protein